MDVVPIAKNLKVLAGRNAVEAYRVAHLQLHSKPWHKEVSDEHTSLLEKMIGDLEKEEFISTQTEFELKKNEILTKFWKDSDLENIKELGFESIQDFENRATETDREELRQKWQ